MELPCVKRQYSLKPDMQFGWRPEDVHGAPIPMNFDFEVFETLINPQTFHPYTPHYLGNRYADSLEVHRAFANQASITGPACDTPSYHMKFPPNESLLDAMSNQQKMGRHSAREFTGMHPNLKQDPWFKEVSFCQHPYLFDSNFESGNLDQAYMTGRREFDLIMRTDTNTRGHHQWFYFSVEN